MKIMTVVGARPNYMKAAPIIMAIRQHNKKTAQANTGLAGEIAVPAIPMGRLVGSVGTEGQPPPLS